MLGISILLSAQQCQQPRSLLTQQAVADRLPYLIKHPELADLVAVDSTGVRMYASAADRKANKPEILVRYEEAEAFVGVFRAHTLDKAVAFYMAKDTLPMKTGQLRRYRRAFPPDFAYRTIGNQPLKGLRIAIDPGHMGGTMEMAALEMRIIKGITPSGDTLQFNEGNLALQTALILQHRLEALGAKVFLTRSKPEMTSFGYTFDTWREKHRQRTIRAELKAGRITQKQAEQYEKLQDPKQLFHRFFRSVDLRHRAEAINQFNPHLTLIIHYNADPDPWQRRDKNGFIPLEADNPNYSMVFVPGSFMRGELSEPELRALFLRILLSPDWDGSLAFSARVMKAYENQLNVPAVTHTRELSYMDASSILAGADGVYARNLTLTRMVNGIICYGEALCQDNLLEAQALAKQDTTVVGVPTNKRVAQVAEAYFSSILDFAKEKW